MPGAGVGTNVYSVIFIGAAIVFLVVVALYLINLWIKYGKDFQAAEKAGNPAPEWTGPIVKTVLVVVVCIVAITWGWNIMLAHTSTMSTYQSPAEKAEQQKVKEANLPTPAELEKIRVDQKKQQEEVPSKEAARSFDDEMKKEAEKIRQRSLPGPAPATEK